MRTLQEGKPLPPVQVHFNDVDPCPLCSLPHNRLTPNSYPIFPASSLLAVCAQHVRTPLQATGPAWRDMVCVLLSEGTRDRAVFINVGVQAGASLAHLHGQSVLSPQASAFAPTDETAREDMARSATLGASWALPGDVSAWVPLAGYANWEVRLLAATTDQLAHAITVVLTRWHELGMDWAYNIYFPTRRVAQLVPATDLGRTYQRYFNVTPLSSPVVEYAQMLQRD